MIVVNDGSTDETLAVLGRTFDLEPIEHFYRRRYESGPIRGLYRSRTIRSCRDRQGERRQG